MRLLVLTQRVDEHDTVLGFFHGWLKLLAGHFETVEVVCLWEGEHRLPPNVSVHSLGKEAGNGRVGRLIRLYYYAWILRNKYDSVFVHMNPEYIVACGLLWRMLGKRIVLWYAHRAVNLKLRIAELFAHAIATSAPESFHLPSKKIHVLGHGIDTARFSSVELKPIPEAPRIVSVGRITPIKHLEVIIDAILLLRRQGIQATLTLVGSPAVKADEAYEAMLHSRIAHDPSAVIFRGPVPYERMHEVYGMFDVAVNACPTGGLDKAVLESMAAGLPTLVANEGFRPYFGQHTPALLYTFGDAEDLAKKIINLPKDTIDLQQFARSSSHERADSTVLIQRLAGLLKT